MPRIASVPRIVSAGAVLLVLAACTPGGQFDPTTLLQNDMFDSKRRSTGNANRYSRVAYRYDNGVPQDLVKGYQPPPEQTDAASAVQPGAAAAGKAEAETQTQSGCADASQKPGRQRISIGPAAEPATDSQRIDFRTFRTVAVRLACAAVLRASTAVAVRLSKSARDGFPLEHDPEKWIPAFRKITLTRMPRTGQAVVL